MNTMRWTGGHTCYPQTLTLCSGVLPCDRAALARIGVSDDIVATLRTWVQDDKKSVVLRFSSVQVSQTLPTTVSKILQLA